LQSGCHRVALEPAQANGRHNNGCCRPTDLARTRDCLLLLPLLRERLGLVKPDQPILEVVHGPIQGMGEPGVHGADSLTELVRLAYLVADRTLYIVEGGAVTVG
jgi:hypothetical protein